MHGPINVKSPNNISEWQMGFNSAFIRVNTIICTQTDVLNDIDSAQISYNVTVKCLSPIEKKNPSGEMAGTLCS